jgi:hypothetical protein
VANQGNKFPFLYLKIDVLESYVMTTLFEGEKFGDIING